MGAYKFIEEGKGKVGVGVSIFDYSAGIGDELGISCSRVDYVLEFMVLYSSYVMGLGNGFRYRDFMVYPDLGSKEFKDMLEGDEICNEVLQRDMIRIYCSYMNMDYGVYNEYRNRGYLMRGCSIRFRKSVLKRMSYFRDNKILFKRKKRLRIRDKK